LGEFSQFGEEKRKNGANGTKHFWGEKNGPKSSHYEKKKPPKLLWLENRFQQITKL
jgi:hypothetical protein